MVSEMVTCLNFTLRNEIQSKNNADSLQCWEESYSRRQAASRKVLGASVAGITTLLSKDFLKLVMVSFVIASPVAWWMMHKWLENYPYHVDIKWQVFAIAGLLSFFISIITVSYQAIKAAIANPVKSLRTE